MVRLAEASARARLSQEATIDDAKRAVTIFEYYLRKIAGDTEGGFVDYDRVTSTVSGGQRTQYREIIKVIRNMFNAEGLPVPTDDVRSTLADGMGMDPEEIQTALSVLIREGEIYTPAFNTVAPVIKE